MSKKSIEIRLSEDSIEGAISRLKAYKADIELKSEEIVRRVAKRIAEEAQSGFQGAVVDDIINSDKKLADVNVSYQFKDGYYSIIANGEDAIWVEFGAGVYHNGSVGSSPNPLASNVSNIPNTPIAIGGFGVYGKRKAWGYYGDDGDLVLTHGTPASMPMYRAIETVIKEIPQIAKEVFK